MKKISTPTAVLCLTFALYYGLGLAYVLIIRKATIALDTQSIISGIGFIIPFMISSWLLDFLIAKPFSIIAAVVAGTLGFTIGALASPAWIAYVACAVFTGLCLAIGWRWGRPATRSDQRSDGRVESVSVVKDDHGNLVERKCVSVPPSAQH